jgi:YVTN family beta-propeller protein/X-X-X-Leu-X-X-Gly heptad repeat protein
LVNIRPQLSWTSVDSDSGDTVRFDVYLDSVSFDLRDSGMSLDTSKWLRRSWPCDTLTTAKLHFKVPYYWQVVARDNFGVDTIGPVWCFTTRDTNHVPNAPHSPSPGDGSTGLLLHTVLSWRSGDPDSGDVVTYDVYLGTSYSPPRVAQGQGDSSYAPANLHHDSLYYWHIVAKDESGDTTAGPLWQFRTASLIGVVAPDTGERLRISTSDTIIWTGGPGFGCRTPNASRITLKSDGVKRLASGVTRLASGVKRLASSGPDAADSTVIYRSTNGGVSWIRHGRASLPGRYFWQVPGPATTLGRVQLRAYAQGETMIGTSGRFEVYDTAAPPEPVTVTSPTGSSVWFVGTVHDVTWTGGTDGVDSSVVYFSSNSGLTWSRQGKAATQGVFAWTVTDTATTHAMMEVRAYNVWGATTGRSDTFSVVVPSTYPDTVIATAAVGPRPQALCYDSIDNRVFVALYNDTGSVAVVDGSTNGIIAQIPVGRSPCALVWNPAGNKVYVANQLDSSVTVINAATNSVVKTVRARAKPYALCYNPVNNKVYVANYDGSSVSVIGGASDSVLATVAVGQNPQAVYWNPADNKVYVANFSANSVSIINGTTNQLVKTVAVAAGPCAITAESTYQETYVADRTGGRVTIIDATGVVVKHLTVGQEPWAVATNPMESRVYAASSASNSVVVISAASRTVLTSVSVAAQPRTLWWAWQFGKLYVACYAGNSVAIIDGASNAVLRTVAVGAKPSAICWNGRANKAYVANYDDGTVSILGPRSE